MGHGHLNELPPQGPYGLRLSTMVFGISPYIYAICIVQDDETYMEKQLQPMSAIYASAKVTIVASDGDATDGIYGLEGIFPFRGFDQEVVSSLKKGRAIVRGRPILNRRDSCSPYFDRGWTFLEYYVSRRRLIFAEKQVH